MTRAGFLIAAALALSGVGAARADDARLLDEALKRAESGDYASAQTLAGRAQDPVVGELVTWARLSRGDGDFDALRAMIDTRADWPRTSQFRRDAERKMPSGFDSGAVIAFFAGEAPLSGTGALRLAQALEARGDAKGAQAAIVRAWTTLDLNAEERTAIEVHYPKLARAHATERLDMLLWQNSTSQAEAMYPLVSDGWRALARARLALRARANGVDSLIAAVPAKLADDPGLAYERFVWRARAGRDADAEALLAQRSGAALGLGRPDMWAERRRAIARQAFREGRAKDAYRLASRHHLSEGSDFADLEWLSGWIALRGLHDPRRAVTHFKSFWDAVDTPISKGRGGYWLGRAYEELGERKTAADWYGRAADNATSFYGQLAAQKIGRDVARDLAAHDGAASWREASFANTSTPRAIILLHRAGRGDLARAFILSLAQTLTTRADFAAAGKLALEIDRPDAAIRLAKTAAGRGHVIMDIYYPVADIAGARSPVEPALALAIARQESELNPEAVSPAGARGMMQLMPGTAKKVAKDLGIGYSLDRLTSDPTYNAHLGKTYLAEMLEKFRGAKILAAAAYNAGPGRVGEWLGRHGDPRRADVNAVDWIESIPFNETRNYVQRVLEGVHVYRARLGADKRGEFAEALIHPQG